MHRALRPLSAADAPMLLEWRNRPAVSRFMYTDHEIGAAEHTAWLTRALAREDARYWIMTRDGEDVGFASITGIDLRQRIADWAIYIAAPDARGHGMGAFTTYTVLEVAFAELALRKLSCEVLAFNTAALSMYERFGFVREGVFREQILKPEGPVDVLRLGILAREWEATRDAHRDRLRARSILTT